MNSTGKELVVRLKKGRPDDIVIAVMGSTGTGKSSFIRLLSGDPNVRVGESLESETSDVQIVRFTDPVSGRNVIIVDTPGFDDSRKGVTDTDILKMVTNFLLVAYDEKQKLNGLIYVQRISDNRFSGQSDRNMRMFRNLCGTEAYQNVVVLTTFWDKVTSQIGAEREELFKTRFFKDLAQGGARFMRQGKTVESARRVIQHILTLTPTNVRIQKEIRENGKSLEDTAAGSVHREEVERMIARHRKEVFDLKAEVAKIHENNRAERKELEQKRAQLQQILTRWETEREELKRGLSEAGEARERLEKDAAKERENQEKLRQDQERKWNSQLDKQGREHDELVQRLQIQLAQEKSGREKMEWEWEQKMRLREQVMNAELETRKREYEKWRQDRDSEWKSEFGVQNEKYSNSLRSLQDKLDQERQRCTILEANVGSMRGREEVEQIIAQYKKEAAGLRAQLEMSGKSDKAVRQELEDERVKWQAERAELKEDLYEAREDRKQLGENAAKEMKDYEKWHRDEESKWRSKLDVQNEKHSDSLRSLQDQLDQERQRCIILEANAVGSMRGREEVEQIIAQHKKEAASLKAQLEVRGKSEKAVRQELEDERAKWQTERKELKKDLDEARGDRKRLEADTEKKTKEYEKWHRDEESKWKSKFDTQTNSMQSLQVQLEQERRRCKILDDNAVGSMRRVEVEQIIMGYKEKVAALSEELKEERARLQQELTRWEAEKAELEDEAREDRKRLEAGAGKEMKNYEKWRQDQESKWRSKFDTQTNSVRSLQAQLDQERQRYKTLEGNAIGSMRREEVEQMIAQHEEETAGLRAEVEQRGRSDKALQQELEDERGKRQTEKAELKKDLDEARKDRKRLEANVLKEKENYEIRCQSQERKWKSLLDAREKEWEESRRSLQDLFGEVGNVLNSMSQDNVIF